MFYRNITVVYKGCPFSYIYSSQTVGRVYLKMQVHLAHLDLANGYVTTASQFHYISENHFWPRHLSCSNGKCNWQSRSGTGLPVGCALRNIGQEMLSHRPAVPNLPQLPTAVTSVVGRPSLPFSQFWFSTNKTF